MTRVRREVWAITNDPSDKTLEWYAKGVKAMRARPINDHRSWRFQAAIHEYVRTRDPLAVAGEALPSPSDQTRYWTQCQHGSWFFLPWHRMYLHHFEAILRQDIVAAGGPADWALPYWNYARSDDKPQARSVPPAFRAAQVNGSANPLFVAERSAAANAGNPIADDVDVSAASALAEQLFSDGSFVGAFGGPETGFMHGGDVVGSLEDTPHGSMHVAIGGGFPAGWMSRFYTAALDPLFWLHHANIDRLWEVWLRQGLGRANPSVALWRDTQFRFRNAAGADVIMTPAQVEDTTSALLDYSYDDLGNAVPAHTAGLAPTPPAAMTTRNARLVGATEQPFEIGDIAHRAVVPTHTARAVTAKHTGAAPVQSPRVFLQFEHLTSVAGAPPYDVYVGVPEGEDPRNHPDRHVGRLSLFGVVEASSEEGPHAGSGLTYSIEITQLLARLRAQPDWDADKLPVTLLPLQTATQARVRVGRVGLYSE